MRVWGFGRRVEGLGFRVEGLGFRVEVLGLRVGFEMSAEGCHPKFRLRMTACAGETVFRPL